MPPAGVVGQPIGQSTLACSCGGANSLPPFACLPTCSTWEVLALCCTAYPHLSCVHVMSWHGMVLTLVKPSTQPTSSKPIIWIQPSAFNWHWIPKLKSISILNPFKNPNLSSVPPCPWHLLNQHGGSTKLSRCVPTLHTPSIYIRVLFLITSSCAKVPN